METEVGQYPAELPSSLFLGAFKIGIPDFVAFIEPELLQRGFRNFLQVHKLIL
jgi:hypothetical protein